MIRRFSVRLLLLVSFTRAAGADTYTVTLDPAAREAPANGRVILFFITEDSPEWVRETSPLEAPFFEHPQPIASVEVRDLKPGESVTLDSHALAFPDSLDNLDGRVRVQAILDIDDTQRSFLDGPGNVYSDRVETTVSRQRDDQIKLTLRHVIGERVLPSPPPNLKWVTFRSELLSEFYGREIDHRAGVALPNGYDKEEFRGRRWPTVYVVPGFGGREDSAVNYADMLRLVNPDFVPQAVWIVLDPESPLGHHAYCDSPNNGPRGTAFVEEFIPHLEREFRLEPREEARLLYGHSSGGWSALWLQLNYSDTFGGCWSSGPDPIDFTRFQYSNLYEDANLYEFAPGNETPSYRTVDYDARDIVHMTTRQENRMEYVIDPTGRSGQQWDSWEAALSPRDEKTGLPKPMFDPVTGEIDREVVAHWRKYDIYHLVHQNWDHYRPILEQKVRLFCGEVDNFYLDRGVERFREMIELRAKDAWKGPGYVRIVEHASHDSLVALTTARMHEEMIEYLASLEAADGQ